MATQYPSLDEMTRDIYQGAVARGIDPNIALKVARSEGLQPGVWQSNNIYKSGKRERSYSPWQMNIDSPNALGSAFWNETGKDPRDPANWKAIKDYALDRAKKAGWGDWYGAAKVGVHGKAGIDDSPWTPMKLGPDTMNPLQPSYPGMNMDEAIDPRKLSPLQLAMLAQQDGGMNELMNGRGLTGPGTGQGRISNPMELAMGQSDPSMFEETMHLGPNAPMNPNQGTVPTAPMAPVNPMSQAMKLGPMDEERAMNNNSVYDMALDGPGTPADDSKKWSLKRALLGAGAGLGSIDNPAGAAIALKMLENMDAAGTSDWGLVSNKYGTYRYNKRTGQIDPIGPVGGADGAGGPDVEKFNEWSAKSDSDAADEYMAAANKSNDELSRIKQLQSLIQDIPDTRFGPAAEALKQIEALAGQMGYQVSPDLGARSAFASLIKQRALSERNPMGGSGMPGNFSDQDRKYLDQIAGGLFLTKASNELIFNISERMFKRQYEASKEAANYIRKNKTRDGLIEHMEKWRKNSPNLLSDMPNYDAVVNSNAAPTSTPNNFQIMSVTED